MTVMRLLLPLSLENSGIIPITMAILLQWIEIHVKYICALEYHSKLNVDSIKRQFLISFLYVVPSMFSLGAI
jgi:hypothetical protein